jgi:hypothetical protein
VDVEAARKRAEQRAARVTAGLEELERWLRDQVRGGLAGAEREGYARFEPAAMRLVDAQAPAAAAAVRRLPGIVASGGGWPGRLLDELARLHLLVAAHRRLGELPPELAASVRTWVGYPTSTASVRELPPVRDRWSVLARRDTEEDTLTTRRVWLQGAGTGRLAVVLSFAVWGRDLDSSLVPGTCVDADVHFYPAAAPLRALVGERYADPVPAAVTGGGIDAALRSWAGALAADPWLTSWPVVLADVVPVPPAGTTPGSSSGTSPGTAGWRLADGDGAALPVAPSAGDPWRLLAMSGGGPVTVGGDWTASGLHPWCAAADGELVPL